MGFLSTVKSWFNAPASTLPNYGKRGPKGFFSAQGGYDGARVDRTSIDWRPGEQNPTVVHRNDAAMLRQRAVDLEMNNPLARAALDSYIANVVECGIRPKLGIADIERRRRIMGYWEHWCESEADIAGDSHFYELQALFLRSVLRDGGSLLRLRTLNSRQSRGRLLPVACELIPEERFSREADTHGRTQDGNPIIEGIEFDAETGRNLGYWIRQENLLDPWSFDTKPIRIDASECTYGYAKTRVGMKRGVTMFAPAIQWLWKLGYFTDNELMASAIKSCFAVLIKTDDDGSYAGIDDWEPGQVRDAHGNLFEKLTPGMVGRLKPHEEVAGVGPNSPGGDSLPWIRLIQRSIAVGCDLSYFELTRDTSESNFAAYRAGGNADRKRFRRLQRFVIHKFCQPSWTQFMRWGVIRGLDGFPTSAEYSADPIIWNRAVWQAPGWEPVTPIDDARANEIEIKLGTRTRQEIIAARGGGDYEDTFEQLHREEQKAGAEEINVTPWVAAETDQQDGESAREDREVRRAA